MGSRRKGSWSTLRGTVPTARGGRRRSYDLVILDLLLPGLDGLSVLRELQQQRPELPVVIVSARGDLPTKLRGFGLGASDYVREAVLVRRAARAGPGAAAAAAAATTAPSSRPAR